MKFRYKKKSVIKYLIIGLIWAVTDIAILFIYRSIAFTEYIWIIMGLYFIANAAYMYYKPYLIIEDGVLIKNTLKPKSIRLEDITEMNRTHGKYTLTTNSTNFEFDKNFLEPESFLILDDILNNLME